MNPQATTPQEPRTAWCKCGAASGCQCAACAQAGTVTTITQHSPRKGASHSAPVAAEPAALAAEGGC
jgi:hypothetical protein